MNTGSREYDEAAQHSQQTLEALRVRRALAEAGDTVYIGEYVLEWSD